MPSTTSPPASTAAATPSPVAVPMPWVGVVALALGAAAVCALGVVGNGTRAVAAVLGGAGAALLVARHRPARRRTAQIVAVAIALGGIASLRIVDDVIASWPRGGRIALAAALAAGVGAALGALVGARAPEASHARRGVVSSFVVGSVLAVVGVTCAHLAGATMTTASTTPWVLALAGTVGARLARRLPASSSTSWPAAAAALLVVPALWDHACEVFLFLPFPGATGAEVVAVVVAALVVVPAATGLCALMRAAHAAGLALGLVTGAAAATTGIDVVGADALVRLAAVALLLVGLVCALRRPHRDDSGGEDPVTLLAAVGGLAFLTLMIPPFSPQRLLSSTSTRFLPSAVRPTSTIRRVLEDTDDGFLALVQRRRNKKKKIPAGRALVHRGVIVGDDVRTPPTERALAHLAASSTPGRARALLAPLHTGTTARALLEAGFAVVDVPSPGPAARAAARSFRRVHEDVLREPALRLIDDDARHALARARDLDLVLLAVRRHDIDDLPALLGAARSALGEHGALVVSARVDDLDVADAVTLLRLARDDVGTLRAFLVNDRFVVLHTRDVHALPAAPLLAQGAIDAILAARHSLRPEPLGTAVRRWQKHGVP